MTRAVGDYTLGGLTVKEHAVMELWDAGLSRQQIIARTDMAPSHVQQIIAAFSHDAADDRAFRRAAIAGSEALAAACIATGSCFR